MTLRWDTASCRWYNRAALLYSLRKYTKMIYMGRPSKTDQLLGRPRQFLSFETNGPCPRLHHLTAIWVDILPDLRRQLATAHQEPERAVAATAATPCNMQQSAPRRSRNSRLADPPNSRPPPVESCRKVTARSDRGADGWRRCRCVRPAFVGCSRKRWPIPVLLVLRESRYPRHLS